MSRITKSIVIACAVFGFFACISARVIKETDRTAVIQGIGPTEFEAKENATKKAEEILGSVKETQKPECDQQMVRDGKAAENIHGDVNFNSTTTPTYRCVMFFEKQ